MLKQHTEESMRERFLKDIAEHKMDIVRDDGVYRHLRFSRGNTGAYSFDIVSYPEYFVVSGDMGDFMFRRYGSEDMFYFFKDAHVNPQYWGEKLRAHSKDDYEGFSPSYLHERLKDDFEDRKDEYSKEEQTQIWDSIQWQILGAENEYEAHVALENFKEELKDSTYTFQDAWEWDLRDYAPRFIWICHAIEYGVRAYFDAKESSPDIIK